ncbi:MAG: hypothetical protein ACP5N2_04770 [Candidatus Nanoarchaeia archaeon]
MNNLLPNFKRKNWHEMRVSESAYSPTRPGYDERFIKGSKQDLEEILKMPLQFGPQITIEYIGSDKLETAMIYFNYKMDEAILKTDAEGIVNISYTVLKVPDKENLFSVCNNVYMTGHIVYDKTKTLENAQRRI